MIYNKIPNTDIEVSKICLGTMTFGEQNTEQEGHEQLDYAVSKGVNFIDTAEMYSVPGRAETQGSTERIIGTWLKDNRDKVVVATKVTGPNPYFSYIRPELNFSRASIHQAIEGSLNRLQTDYVDLYQLHWPERRANFFGKRNFEWDPSDPWKDNFEEIIFTLDELVQQGKIRHYGVSNETPWGVMRHLNESNKNNLTRCKTIQNPYSLLNRTFEVGNAEVSMREKVGLLAYSPLGFGVLSGKYLEHMPKEARITKFPQFSRYNNPQAVKLTQLYWDLAQKHGLSLAQMSLAFVNQQPFVTGNIIGATTMHQLKENIESIDLTLSPELIREINQIQDLQPNPSP
ncbi:MAG: NADP(H)-dependent aldo-keto reductase [Flavobacteriaceae bacterium]